MPAESKMYSGIKHVAIL